MTDPPAGSRYCCGTKLTGHAGDLRLTGRIMRDLTEYDMVGFVVCRCAPKWGCQDPDTIPRGDRRLPRSEAEAPLPAAGYYLDRA